MWQMNVLPRAKMFNENQNTNGVYVVNTTFAFSITNTEIITILTVRR